jgi:hypothetical protein
MPGRESDVFAQEEIMFDGARLLKECSKLMGFRKGDILCLGPVTEPIVISSHDRFPDDSTLRVTSPSFPDLDIPVDDQRKPEDKTPWPGCDVDFISRFPYMGHP